MYEVQVVLNLVVQIECINSCSWRRDLISGA